MRNRCDWYVRITDRQKIEDYLASGLPVVTTDVRHNAWEIARRKCGFVVRYNRHELADVVIRFMSDEALLEQYRSNAFQYSKQFNWNSLIEGALSELS